MSYVYVDDGSKVPASMEVFKDRFGYLEDKDGRKVTNLNDSFAGAAPAQDPSAFTVVDLTPALKAKLDSIEAKLDQVLAK